MREITQVIIHCSATPPNQNIGVDEIKDWHVNRNGWSDIGYHFVIRRNGLVEDGRDIERIGAHAKGSNSDSIGVCLVGGVDEENRPDSNFTRHQWKSLSRTIDNFIDEFGPLSVIGHRDVSSKACPCFNVHEWYNDV